MNPFSRFFERHSFWNPRPSFWVLAMSLFLVGPISDAILDEFHLSMPQLPLNANSLLGIIFDLTWVPGGLYAIGELTKIDESKGRNVVRIGYVMLFSLATLVVFAAVLKSANNMAASIGLQLPLYSTLNEFEEIIVSSSLFVLGVCAVLIRRTLPGSPFTGVEKEVDQPHSPRTLAWYLGISGYVLMTSSVFIGLFNSIALEALGLFISGAALYSTALLVRWARGNRSNRSAPD